MTKINKSKVKENTGNTLGWFALVMDSCPNGIYADFRKEIEFRCGWKAARQTYRNKYNGFSELSLSEYAVIKDVCRQYGVHIPVVEAIAKTETIEA